MRADYRKELYYWLAASCLAVALMGGAALLGDKYPVLAIILLAVGLGGAFYFFASALRIVRRSGQASQVPLINAAQQPDAKGLWTVRNLFLHIKPDLSGAEDPKVKEINADVRDRLSTGELVAWGRDEAKRQFGEQAALEDIRREYWFTASLVPSFFLESEDFRGLVHAAPVDITKGGPQYRDVHVNKAQALKIWPSTDVTLWDLYHSGVELRNKGMEVIEAHDIDTWTISFERWKDYVMREAELKSKAFMNDLKTANIMPQIYININNRIHERNVNFMSTMLDRIKAFLTKDIY